MATDYPVKLGGCSVYPDAASWSEDERILLVANDIIYIITLKGPLYTIANQCPPVAINKISIPSTLQAVATPSRLPGNMFNLFSHTNDMSVFYDQRMIDSLAGPFQFISAKWSPLGCGKSNRCVIATFTTSNRVLIYVPPSKLDTHWHLGLDISAVYYKLLIDVNFKMDSLIGTSDEDEQLSKVTQNVSKIISECTTQQELLVTTALSWLPELLNGLNNEHLAILSMSVRGGYIITWSIKVPIINISDVESKIVNIFKLPFDHCWPSCLHWSISKLGIMLSIGCTSGQLLVLHWESPPTIFTSPPTVLNICNEVDDISINNMKWTSMVNNSIWLFYSKGLYLFGIPFSTPLTSLPSTILFPTIHSLSITGLSLCNNDIISCSLDGSIQCTTLSKSFSSQTIISDPLVINGLSKQVSYNGICTSRSGLFLCLYSNAIGQRKQYSQFSIIPVHSSCTTGFINQLETDICSWDMYEYLRQNPMSWVELDRAEPPLPLMMQLQLSLLSTAADNSLIKTKLMTHRARNVLRNYLNCNKEIDNLTTISLFNNISLLSNNDINPSDQLLINKVISLLTEPFNEKCSLCNEDVPYTSYDKDSCCNGHIWYRCILTLCIIHDISSLIYCSICESKGLYINNGIFEQLCPLCGGYFESVV